MSIDGAGWGADASVRKSVCLSVWRRSVRAIVGPPNLDDSRARTYCACSECGTGCLDIFSIVCNFSFLSPSLSFKTVFFHALDSMEIFSQLDLISSIQR